MELTNGIVIDEAKRLGFTLVGFAEAAPLEEEVEKLEEWLGRNYHADMKYMESNLPKRKNVNELLNGAKSVISLGLNYYTDKKHSNKKDKGKISRYAWGKDYHLIIWDKLKKLESKLKEIDPGFESISYVDTGPVMDKAWAVKAGLGWLGKHTNVINRNMGSWFFIANVITNREFKYSAQITDHCGSCTACIDACPTDAIVDEYIVDSNRCISYLTIENKTEIPNTFKGKFDNWVFGCDICQDVCPWNDKFSIITGINDFYPLNDETEINLNKIEEMAEDEFKTRFRHSPVKRAKLKGLKRNAEFIKENPETLSL